VETDFLPDKDREVEEAELRQKLAKEWELRQQVRHKRLPTQPSLPMGGFHEMATATELALTW